ncbi:MAG: response regulator transcription factor [Myxococcales bacterium]|nr:response regulator transcription factor [Myxococcales bacterium]
MVGRVLLIEDDPSLALGLVDALEFEGFRVLHSRTGSGGIELATHDPPDCIILDLMLPDLNGYQVCTSVRSKNITVPILMLTARSQESDKIRGLDSGADDYMTKPFSVGELVARIRALLRRAGTTPENQQPFRVGGATIDPRTQVATTANETHDLSHYEVELLRYLKEKNGMAVTREEILSRVWGGVAASGRTVDNTIVKLRKKIEPDPASPKHILTVYGIGYKLIP